MIPLILAQACPICPPEPGGICLTAEQKAQVTEAVKELDTIKKSKAEIQLEPIVIIRDWEDRVYINGGEKKPIKLKLKLGPTIDRDMELTLPIQIGYREKPPDPMFRLRFRAQLGFLVPTLIDVVRDGDTITEGLEGGLGLDFFHLDWFNVAVHTGVRSIGGGVGFDLTRNFGLYGGYAFVYSTLKSNGFVSIYFSFN